MHFQSKSIVCCWSNGDNMDKVNQNELLNEDGTKVGFWDLIQWWITHYPMDIFIGEPPEVVEIRKLMKQMAQRSTSCKFKEEIDYSEVSNVRKIGMIANNILYLQDNSDYIGALWDILRIAMPELFKDEEIPELKFIEEEVID